MTPGARILRGAAWFPFAVIFAAACATGSGESRAGSEPVHAVTGDTVGAAAGLVPPGFGSLRQEQVSLRVSLPGIQVRVLPLDEGIIRLLAPDSYRTLRDLQESRRTEIDVASRRAGQGPPAVWYVTFFGLEADARFSPSEVVITSAGRDYRPVEIIPLSTGFGEQRMRQRETQHALYVFEAGLDASQPLTLTVETARNNDWPEILRVIEGERARARSRAMRAPPPA
jgi:hypothetical protein